MQSLDALMRCFKPWWLGLQLSLCATLCLLGSSIDARSKAVIITFDAPNAGLTLPLSINLNGSIVGYYADSSRLHGFVRAADGTITTIDPSGSVDTSATSINDTGSIAGSY